MQIIKRLKLSAQTLGLYKTVIDPTDPECCVGPWTPPKIEVKQATSDPSRVNLPIHHPPPTHRLPLAWYHQLEVNNIHVCATDDQFEPRDLATLWKANKGQSEVMTYKKATLGSLKVSLRRWKRVLRTT